MDTNEHSKTPSVEPGPSGEPANSAAPTPASPAATGEPAREAKSELAHIASPALAPGSLDAADELPALDAEPSKRPAETAEKFTRIDPERPRAGAMASRDIVPLAAPAAGRASRRFSKFTLLAGALVLAAALGAMAGVLGATGVARLAPLRRDRALEQPGLQRRLCKPLPRNCDPTSPP